MLDRSTKTGRSIRVVALAFWLVVTVFPLYWITVTSIKLPGAIYTFPVEYWPSGFSIDNYFNLFARANFSTYIGNSLLISSVAATFATLSALLAAYVLARFQFRNKGAIMLAFLVTQMIPAFIALGPLFLMMTALGLRDTKFGLILVYIAISIPFSTVMLRGFLANVPEALEEAAMIDGCTRIGALFRVIVPVMKPGIVATFIFNFVNSWNELFLSVTLMLRDENRTIPAALNSFISGIAIDWESLSAAAVLTILPTMVLFAIASRYIVQGLTAGSVKG
jgi:multiple sugar transport system permease protein